jgi:hypothetical protein
VLEERHAAQPRIRVLVWRRKVDVRERGRHEEIVS